MVNKIIDGTVKVMLAPAFGLKPKGRDARSKGNSRSKRQRSKSRDDKGKGESRSRNVGHVVWLGIGQRILYGKQNQGPFMKVHQSELDLALNLIKITANRKQQSQFANSTKIRGSASLGLSAISFMIRTTDLI